MNTRKDSNFPDPSLKSDHESGAESDPAFIPEPDNKQSDNKQSGNPDNTNRVIVTKTAEQELDENQKTDSHEQAHANNETDAISGLSVAQQQFVLKFCRQLASVVTACDQSESAEIEVGRRQINNRQIRVKLQAEREFTSPTPDS